VAYLKWIGAAILSLVTIGMVVWNRIRIVREEKKSQGE
jgi:PTS system galactitol-specific IIC component